MLETRARGWPGLFWTAFRGSRNPMAMLDDRRCHVEVNGAYLTLLGRRREELIGVPTHRFVVDGPALTDAEWRAALVRSETTGHAALLRADGSEVTVQYAAHPEVVTGQRLVLFVALSTSRWGRHFRRTISDPEGGLSPRERQVISLIAEGDSGPEIAEALGVSHDTVRTHVNNAMHKLGTRSRAQLVAKALGDGLIHV
jgi:PAS domain S-box-containing protein